MNSNSRTKNTLINTSFAILARVVSMGMGFVQKTVFIRTLGMSYTGVSGLFTDILMVLSLAELGIGTAIGYSLYKPLAENDYERIAMLMNFFKNAYRCIALIIFIVGLCLVPLLQFIVKDVPDINESIQIIFMLYIINSSVSYLLIYKNTLLVAAQNQYIVSNIQMIFNVITIIVQCVTLLIYKQFLLFLILQIVFSLLQNITINWIATKRFPQLRQYKNISIEKSEKKILFKNIRALMLYKIANVVTTGTDSSIISASLGTVNVGIMGNYRTIRGYVSSIIAQFYNSINPSLGNLAATEDKERQFKVFNNLNFGTYWIACFCSTCFFTLFNSFIEIWLGSENWLLSTFTVGIYASEFFFSTMIGPVGAFRQANGLFVQTKYLALIQAILNLVISLLLVKPLGILGVILGTLLSMLITQSWYEPLVIYRSIFKKNVLFYYLRLLLYYVLTIAICITIQLIMSFINIDSIIVSFLIRLALSIIVPNIVIKLLFNKKQEYRECVKLLKKIIKKIFIRTVKNKK